MYAPVLSAASLTSSIFSLHILDRLASPGITLPVNKQKHASARGQTDEKQLFGNRLQQNQQKLFTTQAHCSTIQAI